MQRILMITGLSVCLLGSSGCAAVVALPAFGAAGYFFGRKVEHDAQKDTPRDDPQPVEHAESK